MIKFNFNDLSKQAKLGYNALYNVVFTHSTSFNAKNSINKFTVPLCLNSENKVSLTEKNFIFFESVLDELKLFGFYNIVQNNGRAVEETKTDFYTVEVTLSKNVIDIPESIKTFDFSNVDTSKLMKRNGKEEKQKTEENKTKKLEEKKEQEKTSKELEEKTSEIETLKKEVAKKEEQLNKKAIEVFNDGALLSMANCVETLIRQHCPMIPKDFDFAKFETDLFKVYESHWDLKVLDK